MQDEYYFIKNSNSIRIYLDLSDCEYLSAFGWTSQEAKKYQLSPKGLPLSYAMNFCEYFKLDLENVFSDNFDVKAFARNHLKQAPVLPSRYQSEKNSRTVTLINFVSGLENVGLNWLNELIFRRLQIPQSLLLYPEIEIPLKLVIDYLELVEKYQSNIEFMKSCGEDGVFNLNKKFGFVTSKTRFCNEFYDEFFTDHIRQFDKSYDYQILSLKDNQLQIKCAIKEEMKDIYQIKVLTNKAFVNYKSGIGSGLSTLFGQKTSQSTILKIGAESGYDLISIEIPKRQDHSLYLCH